jgi:hypothetical protein
MNPAVLRSVDRRIKLQHPHIQHARQLRERQRCGADQGCDQCREAVDNVVDAAAAARRMKNS